MYADQTNMLPNAQKPSDKETDVADNTNVIKNVDVSKKNEVETDVAIYTDVAKKNGVDSDVIKNTSVAKNSDVDCFSVAKKEGLKFSVAKNSCLDFSGAKKTYVLQKGDTIPCNDLVTYARLFPIFYFLCFFFYTGFAILTLFVMLFSMLYNYVTSKLSKRFY